MISAGFSYALEGASFVTDMQLDEQKFGITDISIPFYQIALHGLIPYTGRAINLADDYTYHILKTAETGAGLYFSFMKEETAVLQDTLFRQFFACDYDKWKDEADSLYRRFTDDFRSLAGQAIENHFYTATAVTVTVYSDGTEVVVNYGNAPYEYKGEIINAADYRVIRE
jgi:hypothetical protein